MYIRSRIHFITLLLLFFSPLLFVLCAQQGPIGDAQKSRYLAEADSFIRADRYDEALISYFLAYEQGLSRDSLFYLWADLFVKKGDLDSALAVNRSALEICTEKLRKDLLRQRYSIYVFLGADKAASQVSEELGEVVFVKRRRVIPSLYTGFYLKGEREKVNLSDSSYWTHLGSSEDRTIDQIFGFYRLSTNLQFTDLPGKLPDFSVGAIFQIRKNTDVSTMSAPSTFDSLSIEGGGYFRLDNLVDRMGIELRSVYNYDSYRVKRWTHGLVYSFMATEKVFSIGAYNIALKEGRFYDYQQGFISILMDLNRISKVSFTPSLNSSFFLTRQEPLLDAAYSHYLYFDVNAVKTGKLPLFYRDAEMNNPLDTSGLNVKNYLPAWHSYVDQINNGSTEVSLEMPLSHFRIEPGINSAISLNRNWTVKPGMRLGFDIYFRLYRWNEFDKSDLTDYLAFDPGEKSYYQILGTDKPNSVITTGKKVGSLNSQRRFDTDLQGSVSVEHRFKRAGNIIFSLQLNRLWTNLPKACPVEISDWAVAFITDWQYSIDFRKKR